MMKHVTSSTASDFKEKQSCFKCRWIEICIDPCDDCQNFDVTDDKGNLLPGKKYCSFEQGSKKCRQIAGTYCKQYEPKLTVSPDPCVEKVKKMLS